MSSRDYFRKMTAIIPIIPKSEDQPCEDTRQRPWNMDVGKLGFEAVHVASVLKGGNQQCHQTGDDHHQPKIGRPEKPFGLSRCTLVLYLKEFVDTESYGDERNAGPYPRHHRSFIGEPIALYGEPCVVIELSHHHLVPPSKTLAAAPSGFAMSTKSRTRSCAFPREPRPGTRHSPSRRKADSLPAE